MPAAFRHIPSRPRSLLKGRHCRGEGKGGGSGGAEYAHVTGAQQQQMELEEEALINKMAKRLSQLQREKQQLANAVEAEEEHISNTLQRRLALVHSASSCCPRLALACNQ